MKSLILISSLVLAVLAAPQDSGRIIGGKDAKRGDYPFMINLSWKFSSYPESPLCGASIINKEWILTAAHCLTELPAPGTIFATAGMTDQLNSKGEEVWQKIEVVKRIKHKDYINGGDPNDIALLKLKTPLEFNEFVQPVALPKTTDKTTGTTELIGWGSMTPDPHNPHFAAKLQQIELPTIDFNTCKAALDMFVPNHGLAKSNLCAGPLTGGRASCVGDSGGPLLKRDASGLTQRGIVSWGLSPCAMRGAPTVYTDVTYFIDWIEQSMASF